MNAFKMNQVTINRGTFCLDQISLTLPQGMVMAVIGRNGAGKTTLLQSLFERFKIERGDMSIFDTTFHDHRASILQNMAFIQHVYPFPLSYKIGKLIQVYTRLFPEFQPKLIEERCKQLNIGLHQTMKELSLGQRKLVEFYFAIARNVDFLVLDEPMANLDPVIRHLFVKELHTFMLHEQHSILISSHLLTDVEKIADYVVVLDQGQIRLVDTMDQLMRGYQRVSGMHPLPTPLIEQFLQYQKCEDHTFTGLCKTDVCLPENVQKTRADLETILCMLSGGEDIC